MIRIILAFVFWLCLAAVVPAGGNLGDVEDLSAWPTDAQGVLVPENENEARLNRLQPPDHVMDVIGVLPGMVVAEIGAGHGRWVV